MFGGMGARSGAEISGMVTSYPPGFLIGFTGNQYQDRMDVSNKPVGLWTDGPLVSYRGGDGKNYGIVSHSENFRLTAETWAAGGTWGELMNCYNSPRIAGEGQYANRVWICGAYATGNTVYALAHMEWYADRTPPETDADWGTLEGWNASGNAQRQVMSPLWMKSTDNGRTWSIKPTGADRPILKPEPFAVQSRDNLYGYAVPSNIMNEGAYYYAFLDYMSLPGDTDLLDEGFCVARTIDLESSTNWEYWNGTGWTAVNRLTYQGNLGVQQPYMFFKNTGWDPFAVGPTARRMAQSLCWHVPTQQWLLFGFKGDVALSFGYLRSKTLANPRFEQNGFTSIAMASGDTAGNYRGARYISVFDESAPDQNLRHIGNNPICITAEQDRTGFRRNRLEISVI